MVVLDVQIILFQLLTVDDHLAVPYLDHFARQPDYPLYVAFVGFFRKPEDYDVTAFEMAPANALDLVVNELIYEKPLAVIQLRQHRRSLDDDRLNGKNTEEDEHDDDQEDVPYKPQAFGPDSLTRFATKLYDFNVAVVVRRDRSELVLVFPAEIEHNRVIR